MVMFMSKLVNLFLQGYEHVWTTHPPEIRPHSVVFQVEGGGDILHPEYFKQARLKSINTHCDIN